MHTPPWSPQGRHPNNHTTRHPDNNNHNPHAQLNQPVNWLQGLAPGMVAESMQHHNNQFTSQAFQQQFAPNADIVRTDRSPMEQLLWCVEALYFCPASSPSQADDMQRRQRFANHWLQEFQTREDVPSICAMVLHLDAGTSARQSGIANEAIWDVAQLLASQTLHKRLKRRGAMTPVFERELQEFLLRALSVHRYHRAITTQLCLALTALAIRARAIWKPQDIVPDLLHHFSGSEWRTSPTDHNHQDVLLHLLQVLPDQCMDVTISVPKARKDEVIHALQQQGELSCSFLIQCAANSDLAKRSQIIQTFGSWVKLGAVALGSLDNNVLFRATLESISSLSMIDSQHRELSAEEKQIICDAAEVVSIASSSFKACFKNNSRPTTPTDSTIANFFARTMKEVLAPSVMSLAAKHEDMSCTVAVNLVKLGTDLLEVQWSSFKHWCDAVLNNISDNDCEPHWISSTAHESIHSVMIDSPPTISMTTFTFWTKFHLDNVRMMEHFASLPPTSSSTSNIYDTVRQTLQQRCQQMEALVQQLVPLGHFPDSKLYEENWDIEQRDQYKVFRRELRETIRLIVSSDKVVDGWNNSKHTIPGVLVHFVFWCTERCTSWATRVELDKHCETTDCTSLSIPWRELESTLHGLSSVARLVSKSQSCDQVLEKFFTFASNLCVAVVKGASGHRILMRTLAICSGVLAFNGWLQRNQQRTQLVLTVIQCTLEIPEEHPVFPFRDGEDHSGAVALMKLATNDGLCEYLCEQSLNENTNVVEIEHQLRESTAGSTNYPESSNSKGIDVLDPKFVKLYLDLFDTVMRKDSHLSHLFSYYQTQATDVLSSISTTNQQHVPKLSQNSLELVMHSLISICVSVESEHTLKVLLVVMCLPFLRCIREARSLASHASNSGASLWSVAVPRPTSDSNSFDITQWLHVLDRAILSLSGLRVAFTALGSKLDRQSQMVDQLETGFDADDIRMLREQILKKRRIVTQIASAEWNSFTVFLATLAMSPPLPVTIHSASPPAEGGVYTKQPHYTKLLAVMLPTAPPTRGSPNKSTQYVREKPVFAVNERRDHLVYQLCQTLAKAVGILPLDFHPAVPVLARMLLRGMHFLKGEQGIVCIIDNFESVCMITLLDKIVYLCGTTNGASAAALLDVVGHVTAAFLEQCEMDLSVAQRGGPKPLVDSVFVRSPCVCAAYFHLASSMVEVWCGRGIDTRAAMYIGVHQWLEAHRSELSNVVTDAVRCAVIGLRGRMPDRAVANAVLHFLNQLVLTSGNKSTSVTPAAPTLSNPVVSWWSGQFEAVLGSGLGVEILRGLFLSASGGMQSWMIDRITLTFQSFCLRFRDHLQDWITTALNDPEVPKPGVSMDAKKEFIGLIVQDDQLLGSLGQLKKMFKAFCGGKRKGEAPRTKKQ